MNRLGTQERAEVIQCLAEGRSIRETVRITYAAGNTVKKLRDDLQLETQRTNNPHKQSYDPLPRLTVLAATLLERLEACERK